MSRRIRALLLAALLALPFGSVAPPAVAAVSSTANLIEYSGNGATTAFSFPYPYFASSDLVVTLFNTATNANVVPAPVLNGGGTYDYTVTGLSAFSASTNNVTEFASATITFNTAPAGGLTVILQRTLTATQLLNLLDNSKFPASSVNAELDRLTMIAQQLAALEALDIGAPTADPAGLNYTLPVATARASQYACFDSLGNVATCAPSSGVVVSSPMAPVVGASTLPLARQALAGNHTLDDIAIAAWSQGDVLYYNGTDLVRLPAGTPGQLLATQGSAANPLWLSRAVPHPQGRLTLTANTPVMAADATAQTTVRYDCYLGNGVPVWNGSFFVVLSITSCEVTMGLDAGVPHIASGSLYDVFAISNGGALAICAGPAWSSSSSRGSGAGTTQITQTNGGLWTNANALTHCWGGASGTTDFGMIAASQGTYLGTFDATANGQTGMQFKTAPAAGGSANVLALWNAYNRLPVTSLERDSNSANTNSSTTPRSLDNSTSNRVTMIDGLGQSRVVCSTMSQVITNGGSASGYLIGCNSNATTGTPGIFLTFTQAAGAVNIIAAARENFPPAIGLNFYQGMEAAANANAVTIVTPNLMIDTDM
jgi:hypothetical protein